MQIVGFSSGIDNQSVQSPTVVSDLDQKVQSVKAVVLVDEAIEQRYQTLNARTLEIKPVKSEEEFTVNLSEEDENLLVQVDIDTRWAYGFKEMAGVKVVFGANHRVFFLESKPDLVFKPMGVKSDADKYIKTVEEARSVVQKEGLDLLSIPRIKVIQIEKIHFVAQERASLAVDNYHEQKGIYERHWSDPDLNEYMKKLFTQLITFIVKTKFSDVKYDNIPFMVDGRVALIDLDQLSEVKGLVRHGTRKDGVSRRWGILHFATPDTLKGLVQQAKELLGDDFSTLKYYLPGVRSLLKSRVNKNKEFAQYCEKHQIQSSHQLLSEELPKLFDDENKQAFAKEIIHLLNLELAKGKNVHFRYVRRVAVYIGQDTPYRAMAEKYHAELDEDLNLIFKNLQKAECFFRFKLYKSYKWVRVTC
jgi:hypothetical protein